MKPNSRTRVVNKHHTRDFDVYIGRGSIYGNPYEIGKDGTREEVIEKYRELFNRKLNKPRFKRAVDDLKGKKLGCFCRPAEGFQGRLLCHGQILASYLEGCNPEDIE